MGIVLSKSSTEENKLSEKEYAAILEKPPKSTIEKTMPDTPEGILSAIQEVLSQRDNSTNATYNSIKKENDLRDLFQLENGNTVLHYAVTAAVLLGDRHLVDGRPVENIIGDLIECFPIWETHTDNPQNNIRHTQNNDGDTILHIAASAGDKASGITKVLLEREKWCYGSCNVLNHQGKAPMNLAAEGYAFKAFQELHTYTSNLDAWLLAVQPRYQKQFNTDEKKKGIQLGLHLSPALFLYKLEYLISMQKQWKRCYDAVNAIVNNKVDTAAEEILAAEKALIKEDLFSKSHSPMPFIVAAFPKFYNAFLKACNQPHQLAFLFSDNQEAAEFALSKPRFVDALFQILSTDTYSPPILALPLFSNDDINSAVHESDAQYSGQPLYMAILTRLVAGNPIAALFFLSSEDENFKDSRFVKIMSENMVLYANNLAYIATHYNQQIDLLRDITVDAIRASRIDIVHVMKQVKFAINLYKISFAEISKIMLGAVGITLQYPLYERADASSVDESSTSEAALPSRSLLR